MQRCSLLFLFFTLSVLSCKKDAPIPVEEVKIQKLHDIDQDGICDMGWIGENCDVEYRDQFVGKYMDVTGFDSYYFQLVPNPLNILGLQSTNMDGIAAEVNIIMSEEMDDSFSLPFTAVGAIWTYGNGYFYGSEKDSMYLHLNVMLPDSSWQELSAKLWAYRID